MTYLRMLLFVAMKIDTSRRLLQLQWGPLASGFSWETANRKTQNVTCPRPCGHVCSLQFTFEPPEGLPAVSDLRQGFWPQKNCTASRLKV